MVLVDTDKQVIIVTGSCGRIGTQVVKKLDRRYSIIGLEHLKAIYAADNEELVPVDLSSDESVAQAFRHIRHFYGNKIVSVIHLAAYYSFDEQHSTLYDLVTVKGTERLLKALQAFEVEQFIFSSTMLVYAPTELGKLIDESSPVSPKWDYPVSKVHTEAVIAKNKGSAKSVILRIAGVYDDQCHSIPISHQIQRIYEKQMQARLFSGDTSHGAAFLHMDDLVDSILFAVEKRKELSDEVVLLIGEEQTMSYDALQRKISKLLYDKEFKTIRIPKLIAYIGAFILSHIPFIRKPFIKPWMIAFADDHYELNIEKTKNMLGWRPKHFIGDTLPKMIANLKKDPLNWYKINGLKFPRHFLKRH
jgi:nucleoside-diphosphate-sugar epimerase